MSQYDPNKILVVKDLVDSVGPFFDSALGSVLGELLFKFAKVNDLNTIGSRHWHLRHAEFAKAVLADPDIGVSYRIHGEEYLERMKREETFVTVSNHPFGGIDGLILVAIIGSIRPDYKVLVNNFLSYITPLADTWIPIHPRKNKKNYQHVPEKNISGLRMVAKQLSQGHPMGLFPAGGIAHYDWAKKKPKEQPWQMNSVRILSRAGQPIYPVMFGGENSKWFYHLGRISYNLNVLRIPVEILNKQGQTIDVYIGEPITPEELRAIPTLKETRTYLMDRCLGLIR